MVLTYLWVSLRYWLWWEVGVSFLTFGDVLRWWWQKEWSKFSYFEPGSGYLSQESKKENKRNKISGFGGQYLNLCTQFGEKIHSINITQKKSQ